MICFQPTIPSCYAVPSHSSSTSLKSPWTMPTSVEMSLSLTFQANVLGESQPEWGKPQQWHCRPIFHFVLLWNFDANQPAWWCADHCLLNLILQNGERFVAQWFDSIIKIQNVFKSELWLSCRKVPPPGSNVKGCAFSPVGGLISGKMKIAIMII